jgi:hypothetical protein
MINILSAKKHPEITKGPATYCAGPARHQWKWQHNWKSRKRVRRLQRGFFFDRLCDTVFLTLKPTIPNHRKKGLFIIYIFHRKSSGSFGRIKVLFEPFLNSSSCDLGKLGNLLPVLVISGYVEKYSCLNASRAVSLLAGFNINNFESKEYVGP